MSDELVGRALSGSRFHGLRNVAEEAYPFPLRRT
jgi:hypothetical protein